MRSIHQRAEEIISHWDDIDKGDRCDVLSIITKLFERDIFPIKACVKIDKIYAKYKKRGVIT